MLGRNRRRAVALAAGLLLASAALAQVDDDAELTWLPPTQNTDGSPLTNLAGYRIYWGMAPGVYPNARLIENPGATSAVVPNLAPGAWYFAVSALNALGRESDFSNVACVAVGPHTCFGSSPPTVPGAVRNLTVRLVSAPPPPAVTVTFAQVGDNDDQFRVQISAPVEVRLQLQPSGAVFDWLKVGATTSGSGGTPVPTTPPIGANNNDRVTANAITVTGPVDASTDIDGSAHTGITATVNGVTKQLVRSGTTWSAAF